MAAPMSHEYDVYDMYDARPIKHWQQENYKKMVPRLSYVWSHVLKTKLWNSFLLRIFFSFKFFYM